MTEENLELEELCKDNEEQDIICPNCKSVHHVYFNPYYVDTQITCVDCGFKTSSWQFDIVWE